MMRMLLSAVVLLVAGVVHGAEIEAKESLKEVNRGRAKKGLRPFKEDPLLTKAAMRAAKYRAKRLHAGHFDKEFSFVPKGGRATAIGCGALEPSWGWGTCCHFGNHRYAGAAWALGRDGKRYMHLYVR